MKLLEYYCIYVILFQNDVIVDRILVVKQRNMGKVVVMEVVECQNCTMARQTQKW